MYLPFFFRPVIPPSVRNRGREPAGDCGGSPNIHMATSLECHETLDVEPPRKKQRLENVVIPLPGGFFENLLRRASTPEVSSPVAQHPVFPRWRRIVCDWMSDVCFDMNFSCNIYALSVAYMDRYLTYEVADKQTYQCVATTCIWMALKYDCSDGSSWAIDFTTADTAELEFSARDMCRMEMHILNRIHWRLDIVIPHVFVRLVLSEHWDPLCDRTMVLFPRQNPISLAMGVVLSIQKCQKICLSHPFIDIMRSKADADVASAVCNALTLRVDHPMDS